MGRCGGREAAAKGEMLSPTRFVLCLSYLHPATVRPVHGGPVDDIFEMIRLDIAEMIADAHVALVLAIDCSITKLVSFIL
uniref:Uncharacterized protein n=1 Tax=Leersia perrieri TaxID=77586 RepID=A0A0D9WNZ7_9ORYZ